MREPVVHNNRTLNHEYSSFVVVEGNLREIKHPFLCDDCKTESALYGCIEIPGLWLRCPQCHLSRITKET